MPLWHSLYARLHACRQRPLPLGRGWLRIMRVSVVVSVVVLEELVFCPACAGGVKTKSCAESISVRINVARSVLVSLNMLLTSFAASLTG